MHATTTTPTHSAEASAAVRALYEAASSLSNWAEAQRYDSQRSLEDIARTYAESRKLATLANSIERREAFRHGPL